MISLAMKLNGYTLAIGYTLRCSSSRQHASLLDTFKQVAKNLVLVTEGCVMGGTQKCFVKRAGCRLAAWLIA